VTTHRPAVRFVFLTLLLDVIGIGLIIPVGPRLVEELYGRGTEWAAVMVAFLSASYAAMQFIFAPILGGLSDRYGRRPVILLSLLGSGLYYLAAAVTPSLFWLFVTRVVNGIAGANVPVCNAYVADVTPPEKRAAGFGMMGAAFGLGFVLGPLLGGVLGEIHIRLPFAAAGVLTLANWLYGYFVLPESLPRERRRAFSLARANPLGTFTHLVRYPIVLGLAASMFLLNLAMFGLHATWVLYTAHRFHWSGVETGLSLTIVGLGAAVVQGGLVRRIVPWLGEPRALILGISIVAASYFGYGLSPWGWLLYVILTVASLGGIAQPAGQAIITKAVPPNEQGEVQGALTSLQGVAAILGPLIGGGVFAYFISGHAPVYLPGAPYLTSGVLSICGLLVAWAVLRRFAAPSPGPAA
jgi:DHA1 family tetracycline resistance protein-like MFS transporter